MPKLIIDNLSVEVPPGTKVIQAAERAGIMIPRFCYHPALGSVGACRVCAVHVLEGSCHGIRMSCMIEAEEDMVISTSDDEAVAFRRQVIEWLMANHPHDCPVCDEGGQCLLQDMTVSGGHGRRRFPGKKRTYTDQHLGPLVQHEMNRCIQCYRCVRFYREYAGYHDLGVMGSAGRVTFGRRGDGILESPFAGNLIDVCPTGVFTDKPSRFKGRYWDFERTPGVCIHCSLGCNITVYTRYREVVRQEAAFNPVVNGYFICDRGRYGFEHASCARRPRRARVDGCDTAGDEALRTAVGKLTEIDRRQGPQAVALATSTRASLETLGALAQLCRRKGWRGPFAWPGPHAARTVQSAVANLEKDLAVSLKDIEKADFILVAGADPVNEAPMLAMALRQAHRAGAAVAVLDSRPVALPFDAEHLPLRPSQLTTGLMLFAGRAAAQTLPQNMGVKAMGFYEACRKKSIDQAMDRRLAALADTARASSRPVIVCGTQAVSSGTPAAAADTARLLRAVGKNSGLFNLLPGANAFAAALVCRSEDHFAALHTGINNGQIKALVVVETDLAAGGISPEDTFIKNLELLITCDYLDTDMVRSADIFIPTQTIHESGGTFVNQEARIQAGGRAFAGGAPIAQVGSGDHPPRIFETDIPGSEPRPAWQVLAALVQESSAVPSEPPYQALPQPLAEASALCPPAHGTRMALPEKSPAAFGGPTDEPPPGDGQLEVVTTELIFGSEPLSRHSSCLQKLETPPRLGLHPEDAAALKLATGRKVALDCGRGIIEGEIELLAEMARGAVLVPKHRKLNWQAAADSPVRITLTDIRTIDKNGGK